MANARIGVLEPSWTGGRFAIRAAGGPDVEPWEQDELTSGDCVNVEVTVVGGATAWLHGRVEFAHGAAGGYVLWIYGFGGERDEGPPPFIMLRQLVGARFSRG